MNRSKGIVCICDNSCIGGRFLDRYHLTFHHSVHVIDHWSEYFEIKAYVLCGALDFQDYLLTRSQPDHSKCAAELWNT